MPAAAQASRDAWKADVAALRSEGRAQPSSRKDEIGSRYAFLAELKRLLNHQVGPPCRTGYSWTQNTLQHPSASTHAVCAGAHSPYRARTFALLHV